MREVLILKSFLKNLIKICTKNKWNNEESLREKLGDKFQGKIIRGKMWIYNDSDPLNLSLDDIVESLR